MTHNNRLLLIIGTVWPEPNSSAAGTRMIQLIKLFKREGWNVVFASSAADSEFSADLKDLGVDKKMIELNSCSFDEFIKNLKPDAVMFDRFMTEEQYGWRVAEQCPNALRILDSEDLHCLRKGRQEALKQGRDFQPTDLLLSETAFREVASIHRCDLALIISEYEIMLLQNHLKTDIALLIHTPFLFDAIEEKDFADLPPYQKREHFITIGNFLHPPNRAAVLWLKEEIWPMIRKTVPEAKLHVYGAYPAQRDFQLHNEKEGFIVKGRAESAADVIRKARVLLAPLQFGAGLKGKLTDAMRAGTPSVTTPIGAEGMNGNLPWPGFIERTAEDFAKSATELYKNETIWKGAQQHGKEIINHRFSAVQHGEQLMRRINEILSDLKKHRKKNFTGSMLRHHSHASTKYMSRWIEEKNRSK